MRMSHSAVAMCTLVAAMAAQPAGAQRRPAPTPATKAGSAPQQSGGASTKNPSFTLFGGVASGEDGWNLGYAIAASLEWKQSAWPVGIRVDPYIARHGADVGSYGDFNLTLIGAAGAASYDFETTSASAKPFIFGGLGIYNGSADFDSAYPGYGAFSVYDGTDLGIELGGGIRIGKRLTVELRYMHIDQFDTIPILAGFRF